MSVCLSVCLSVRQFVRPSVTRRYCIQTAKPIIKPFGPSGSHITLLFLTPRAYSQFQRQPHQLGRKIHWGVDFFIYNFRLK